MYDFQRSLLIFSRLVVATGCPTLKSLSFVLPLPVQQSVVPLDSSTQR